MTPIPPASSFDAVPFAIALGINIAAIATFAIGIYYRRHRRDDLAMVLAFSNLSLFIVVTVIMVTTVSVAIGFGLFAILSIIRLRSEAFTPREIGYFFGALVLGLVNGIGTPSLALTVGLNVVLLVAIWLLDHQQVLAPVERRQVVLDVVETDAARLRHLLHARLDTAVQTVEVRSVDFVRGTMKVEVQCPRSASCGSKSTVAPTPGSNRGGKGALDGSHPSADHHRNA